MTDDSAGGMVHGAMDRESNVFADVQCRHQGFGFLGIDEVAFHSMKLSRGDAHAHCLHRRDVQYLFQNYREMKYGDRG